MFFIPANSCFPKEVSPFSAQRKRQSTLASQGSIRTPANFSKLAFMSIKKQSGVCAPLGIGL